MFNKFVCVVWLMCFIIVSVSASNILLVFPAVSTSHFKVGEALTLGLAKAGHNVTLLSPYDYKTHLKNVEVVQLTGAIEVAAGKLQMAGLCTYIEDTYTYVIYLSYI